MATPINTQTRASDRPIDDADHDDFHRDPFALRIAQTLIDRQSPESIVVGLYGKWGEGKTSVLQLLRKSLLQASDKVVVMEFNPWRFPDETQLLTNFFGKLAQTIDKNLHTVGQRAAQSISKYSKLIAPMLPTIKLGLPFVGGVELDPAKIGNAIESVADASMPDLEDLKKQVEQLIADSGRRVIIIIDDIDRLEKKQIQAIFRLVKLTADFKQTAYLLAFDDVMVSRAIGEMFESSTEGKAEDRTLLAGQNFLEKIIQVPLRLPRARPDDLLRFCWARLTEALKETATTLEESDQQQLIDALRSAILPRLTTPRLAVRYGNAVQFGLPLLRGEVNAVDQVLVEAMHIFYPQLHQFVATNESAFAGSLQSDRFYFLAGQGNSTDEKHKQLIDGALKNYEGDDSRAALSLLCILFPRVNKLYQGNVPWVGSNRITDDTLTKRKAVAAVTHFARYFAYAIVTGDVSDSEFSAFLQASVDSQLLTAEGLITRLGVSRFLQKIEYQVQEFTPEQAKSLWSLIIGLNQQFDGDKGALSETDQAAKLLLGLLFQITTNVERRQLIEQLIQSQATFDFTKVLFYRLLNQRKKETLPVGYSEDEPVPLAVGLFTLEEWQELMDSVLPQLFLDRALAEAGSEPIYKSHQSDAYWLLFSVWPSNASRPDMRAYVNDSLAQSPENIYDLLAACSSLINRGAGEYMANMTSNRVHKLVDLFGSSLYDVARQVLGPEPVSTYPGEDPDQPTSKNRLRQFIYLYENLENYPAPVAP